MMLQYSSQLRAKAEVKATSITCLNIDYSRGQFNCRTTLWWAHVYVSYHRWPYRCCLHFILCKLGYESWLTSVNLLEVAREQLIDINELRRTQSADCTDTIHMCWISCPRPQYSSACLDPHRSLVNIVLVVTGHLFGVHYCDTRLEAQFRDI